jgi:multiple sugar transport system permease protein
MSSQSLAGRRAASVARYFDRPGTAVWLLLGPCLLYLAAFAIYPLIYSLRLSFTDLTAADGTGHWVGLRNYADLLRDPLFWNAAENSVIMVTAAVSLQVVLGAALALFFNLHLTGSWIVRGILVLPMLITPIVVGVMWRALLNPDWGLVNWVIEQFGFEPPNWLGSIGMAMKTLIMVDVWQWTPFVFIIVYARLQALPQDVFEAAQLDGATRLSTLRRVTLPLLMPVAYLACPVAIGITGVALPVDAGIGATWDNFRDPPWVNR